MSDIAGVRSPQLSAAMLRWFDEHAADGILTTDDRLVVESWNEWLASATGIPAHMAVGRPLLDVVPSLATRGLDHYFAEALSGQVTILSQTLHRFIVPATHGSTGEQMLQSGRITPLYDGSTIIGTIAVIEDVTERVASERELRAQIRTAETARIAAEGASRIKDEFLATLSHEIRTPLNAVLGWTRILLAREQMDAPTVRRAIEVIDRNASAQLTLIGDMLDMARIAAGKIRLDIKPIDFAAVVLAGIDVIRPAADAKGVRLVTELAPHLPLVNGDADRLQQVVWNLLSNAVKFTDKGGIVTVSLELREGTVRLKVRDTGQGIAPAFLREVFERFRQADPSASRRHGGLGLGLALVRELVELHGGTVSVDSAGPGTGATFVVVLYVRAAAELESRPVRSRPSLASSDLAGVHVLIVEDDADAMEIAARTVRDAGAMVTTASSVAEAMAALRSSSHLELPDVVISDIGMPHNDGYALVRELRELPSERGGRLPAIAVTAYATSEDRSRALSAGFEAHLAKPYAPKILLATIAQVVARETD